MINTVCNQKGGVGKTAFTVNVSYQLASMGKKVLVVDTDPQGNASSTLCDNSITPNTLDVLLDKNQNPGECFYKVDCPYNLYVMPSNIDLMERMDEVNNRNFKEFLLKNQLSKILHLFDEIIIDTAPSFSVATRNAIVASDRIIIPIDSSQHALRGLNALFTVINQLDENKEKSINIFRNEVDGRKSKTTREIEGRLMKVQDVVCNSVIRVDSALGNATWHNQTIFEYAPKNRACQDYVHLTEELFGG